MTPDYLARVQDYWETDGEACHDCPCYHEWQERHAPGMSETMNECRLLEGDVRYKGAECPGLLP